MLRWSSLWQLLKIYKRGIILVLTPIMLLPLPLTVQTLSANCGYVVLLMATFWLTSVLHLGIVSLFPMVLFPLLGIMDTNTITSTYFKDNNVVYFACLVIGIAIEQSNFHSRMALALLLKIGTSPRLLLLGVMLATMLISMWIMNTVAAAMMIPIVEAIFDNLQKLDQIDKDQLIGLSDSLITEKQENKYDEEIALQNSKKLNELHKYKKGILLSVAYAANIGGTGTATSTSPNIVFTQILSMLYGDNTGVSYASWALFALPNMFTCILASSLVLQLMFFGFRPLKQIDKRNSDVTKATLLKEYRNLGPLTFHEGATMVSFSILVLLFFFRKPHFMTGWEPLINSGKVISDAVPAVLLVIVMCAFPNNLSQAFNSKDSKPADSILNWEKLQAKVPWDLIFLQGSGYALAAGFRASGLDIWLGDSLMSLETLNSTALCYVICIIASFSTEIFSNASTAAIMLPVVARMAENVRVNPLYYMIPLTICSSFSFMVPIATGPNAMVYKSGKMKVKDMLFSGFITNFVCITILFLFMNSLAITIFDLNSYPVWANLLARNTSAN